MIPRLAFLLCLVPGLISAADLVFAEESDWEVVSAGHQFAEGMAWGADGHFYFTDVPRNQGATGRANGIAFGSDGRLYGCASGDQCI